MFQRQQSGSVLCPSCNQLVGVKDERCYNCGRRNPGLWGYAALFRALGRDLGFVPLVTWGCTLLYILTLIVDLDGIRTGGLSILGPSQASLFLFGASGGVPMFAIGGWWTPLSAGWLHGGVLHIFFNLYWVRGLGGAAIDLYGAGRTMIIYTLSSVVGFVASSCAFLFPFPGPLRGAGLTIGASAAIFGLLGALFHYGQRAGSSAIGQQAKSYAIFLGLFGFILPGVDNWAHLGGFAGGYFAARWLDPLKPERVDHLFLGIACLAASALAIVYSVLHGRPLLG